MHTWSCSVAEVQRDVTDRVSDLDRHVSRFPMERAPSFVSLSTIERPSSADLPGDGDGLAGLQARALSREGNLGIPDVALGGRSADKLSNSGEGESEGGREFHGERGRRKS